MKLVIAVVSDKDAPLLLDQLIEQGYRATKLASTGGFLKEGNTTLFMGIEEEKVENVLAIIKSVCRSRPKIMTPIAPLSGPGEAYVPYSVEVPHGGATIFVLDVEKYLKV
ncbi:MAG: cyclic-di-AMP receptor [Bacillota bacterium]